MPKSLQRVVFDVAAARGLQRGVNLMVDAVKPTLGPHARRTALERPLRDRPPELLDDAGTIARRTIQLPDRDADMGAMLARDMLSRMRERTGDGAATAGILLQSILNLGLTYLASGGSAMQLRKHLDAGVEVILAELDAMRREVAGEAQLTRLARGVCSDTELASVMGEIFHVIGENGGLEIRSGNGREIRYEFVEGSYWEGGVLSPELIFDKQRLRTDLEHPAILATDCAIEQPRELVPILDAAVGAGIRSIVIIARSMTAEALSLLLSIPNRRRILALAVKAPPSTEAAALEDIAVLSGGRAIHADAGRSVREAVLEDLGRARWAWADKIYFSLGGGAGDPRALRKHLDALAAARARAKTVDERAALDKRIGAIFGGAALLYLGAATESELDARKDLAGRAAEALRGAMREGVVGGGGAALLACRPALERRMQRSRNADERAAYRILMRGLAEPMRAIVANAGRDPDAEVARVLAAGPGYGFDAERDEVVEMSEQGILDAVSTLKAAVHAGISTAAMALTTAVLVHHKKLETDAKP